MDPQDLFELVPSEIMVDIISRLPIRTILICKCVSHSWLNLLESDAFVQYHLSKSVPSLVLQTVCSPRCKCVNNSRLNVSSYLARQTLCHNRCEIYESVDLNIHNFPKLKHHTPPEFLDLNILNVPKLKHHNPLVRFESPLRKIKGSVDGLLITCHDGIGYNQTIDIVNPTTREYIEIDCSRLPGIVAGFGVSRKTGEYKVIRISGRNMKLGRCEVYTLGTGSWRSISSIPAHVHHLEYISLSFGAFVNGNLHWLAYDFNDRVWISCFDLEYEHFSMFASPLPPRPRSEYIMYCLSALDGCLWLTDSSSDDDEVVIWVLKDYGDEKTWRKEWVFDGYRGNIYVDNKLWRNEFGYVCVPIKVSEYGDRLFAWTTHEIWHIPRDGEVCVRRGQPMYLVLHTSSFLSLNSFSNEKVLSFKDLNDC